MKRFSRILLGMLALVVTLGAGCARSTETLKGGASLKIGIMPAVDAAPILLAEEKGYFKELGLDVEVVLFNNAQDRQSALQTDAIDGAITDLVAVAVNVDGGFDIKATMMTHGVFPVLMKETGTVKQEVKVGLMEVSVTNFLAEQWLGEDYTMEKVFINEIPTRLAAIVSGELDMGIFPEPFASMGALQGLEKMSYDFTDGYCPDVMVFTGKALRQKEEAVLRFHQAYNKAITGIQNNEQEARRILIERLPNLKPEIQQNILLPEYAPAALQDAAYIQRVIDWTALTLGRELTVTPEDLVDGRFVQK